jgi:hypothetical protein
MPAPKKKLLIRCPLKHQGDHTPTRPATLTSDGVKHIKHQIEQNEFATLPHLAASERFFQCRDCCAVWLASSPYAETSESDVLGIYTRELVWKPYK